MHLHSLARALCLVTLLGGSAVFAASSSGTIRKQKSVLVVIAVRVVIAALAQIFAEMISMSRTAMLKRSVDVSLAAKSKGTQINTNDFRCSVCSGC